MKVLVLLFILLFLGSCQTDKKYLGTYTDDCQVNKTTYKLKRSGKLITTFQYTDSSGIESYRRKGHWEVSHDTINLFTGEYEGELIYIPLVYSDTALNYPTFIIPPHWDTTGWDAMRDKACLGYYRRIK